MRLLHEFAIFQTVKSKVIISLFETVRLSVSISPRNLYNSLNSIKEKNLKKLRYLKQFIRNVKWSCLLQSFYNQPHSECYNESRAKFLKQCPILARGRIDHFQTGLTAKLLSGHLEPKWRHIDFDATKCDVISSHRRSYDIIFTSCARWELDFGDFTRLITR